MTEVEPLTGGMAEGEAEQSAAVRESEQGPGEAIETLPPPVAAPTRPLHPATPATVQRAIEEVNQIIDSLRETLDDMEEVLEMLEVFERQGNADERELESLRRALRQMQRPREGGSPHRGRS